MKDTSNEMPADLDEPVIDGAFIDGDLGISPRTRRNYLSKQILPPPDANLQGRDIWRLSTYREFKAALLAGRFAVAKRPPHLRAAKTAA
ncbi:MAG: hypothetical protein M3N97_14885 [Pseudomonadota bacterium]|nr:hypothetical protein [Pseudomonadota bacterium]